MSVVSKLKKEVMEKWQASKPFDWQKDMKELDLYIERKIKEGYCICKVEHG